jgi:hypothetical protein
VEAQGLAPVATRPQAERGQQRRPHVPLEVVSEFHRDDRNADTRPLLAGELHGVVDPQPELAAGPRVVAARPQVAGLGAHRRAGRVIVGADLRVHAGVQLARPDGFEDGDLAGRGLAGLGLALGTTAEQAQCHHPSDRTTHARRTSKPPASAHLSTSRQGAPRPKRGVEVKLRCEAEGAAAGA